MFNFFFLNYTCLLENIHVDIKTLTQRERDNFRKDFWLNFLLVINKTEQKNWGKKI